MFFEFIFLKVVFCMLYVELLMIPKTKNLELLYSQSQQVAASGCSDAGQLLEARPGCTVRVHEVTPNTFQSRELASTPYCGCQIRLALVTCACPAQMGCWAHHWRLECQTAAALWQW